jgi:site-specific DNA recombinase
VPQVTFALRYRRVSSVKQEDNSSLSTQQARCDTYCEQQGYFTNDDLLFTEGLTAVDTWGERPVLNQLLNRLETLLTNSKEPIVVVVDHPDRFARGFDLIMLVGHIERLGGRVEFVQQKFENDEIGKIVLHLHSWGSKQEWLRIKKRTEDGRINRVVNQHRLLGSIPLYGYSWDNEREKNKYVFNDTIIYIDQHGESWSERLIVFTMYQLAKDGWTLGRIANHFNKLGLPTRQKHGRNHWTQSRIGELLGNPKYMGQYYALASTYTRVGTRYKRTPKPYAERVLIPDACPAIIDEETWYIVQAQLDYNKAHASRNTKHPEAALCRYKIARCAYCHGAMNVKTDGRWGTSYYFCQRANAHNGCDTFTTASCLLVDKAVWKRICEVIRDPLQMREAIEALKAPDPTEKERASLKAQKEEAEQVIDNIVDSISHATTKRARKKFQADLHMAEEEFQEIERREKILQGGRKNWEKAELEIKRFENWCISKRDSLETASFKEKRNCVEYMGVRVFIYRLGHKPRVEVTFSPQSILDALSGEEKKGELTLNTPVRSSIPSSTTPGNNAASCCAQPFPKVS